MRTTFFVLILCFAVSMAFLPSYKNIQKVAAYKDNNCIAKCGDVSFFKPKDAFTYGVHANSTVGISSSTFMVIWNKDAKKLCARAYVTCAQKYPYAQVAIGHTELDAATATSSDWTILSEKSYFTTANLECNQNGEWTMKTASDSIWTANGNTTLHCIAFKKQ